MLALRTGPFPESAFAKAEEAYGDDIGRKLTRVLERLSQAAQRRDAAAALGMDAPLLEAAAHALAGEVRRLRPRWLRP